MTALPETGPEIPADVRDLAEKAANGLVYSGRGTNFDATVKAFAEAIMADRAARLASLEALLHDIASDCRSPTAHAGNALRQIGDKIERAVEGLSAGVASLEAERAKTVEAYRAGVEETCREWAPPEDWSDAELTQQGLDARRRAAWVKKEMMKDWRIERALALASEKGAPRV